MEFFKQIWDKIKALFSNKVEPVDQAAIDQARAQRLEQFNDPEDAFEHDVAYDEEELASLARKSANSRNMRAGYYIVVGALAVGMVIYGLVSFFITPKPDFYILIQNDGVVAATDLEQLQAVVADVVGDRNGDGKTVIDVTMLSMPAQRTEENASVYDAATQDLATTLVPGDIAILFGRKDFLTSAVQSADLNEEWLSVADLGLDITQGNPLCDYYVAHTTQSLAQEVYQQLS